jgi:hypothetical protein
MKAKRIFLALIAATLLMTQTSLAAIQSEQNPKRHRGGWAAIARAGQTVPAGQFESTQESAVLDQSQEPGAGPGSANDGRESVKAQAISEGIVGTWVMHIPASPGSPAFDALQTYNDDGTMTETSSLLAHLAEGPAHGVWKRATKKDTYDVTFELFAFDENGDSVGRIRVRVLIRLTGKNNLSADTVVDFIEPDGTVIPNIGSSPFTGIRVRALSAQ